MSLLKYAVYRFFTMLVTLWVVSILVFFIINLPPGDYLSNQIAELRIEQIAEKADIAPATFFNHFQSKSGLLAEITGDVAEALEGLIEEHLGADGTVNEQLEGLARHAAEMIAEHQKVAREVMLEMLRSGARPEDAAPYLASLHRPLTTMLAAGQGRGEVRTDQDAEFLAEMVLGAFHATVSQWLSDETYPIAERLPRAASFIWDAIRAGSAG